MKVQESNVSPNLREMIAEALSAYEIARLSGRRRVADIRAEHGRQLEEYELARRAAQSSLAESHAPNESVGRHEQQRMGQLATYLENVASNARILLDAAGLAYVVGAPLSAAELPAPTHVEDAEVARLFAQAQIARTDLRIAMYEMATGLHLEQRWDEARMCLKPLLGSKETAIGQQAGTLLRETYVAPVHQALSAKDLEGTYKALVALLNRFASDFQEWHLVRRFFEQVAEDRKQDLLKQFVADLRDVNISERDLRQHLGWTTHKEKESGGVTSLLWTRHVKTDRDDDDGYDRVIRHLRFSHNSELLAIVYECIEQDSNPYHDDGVLIVIAQSGKVLHSVGLRSEKLRSSYSPIIALVFDDENKILYMKTAQGSAMSLMMSSGILTDVANSKMPKVENDDQDPGAMFVAHVVDERALGVGDDETFAARALSADRQFLAVADRGLRVHGMRLQE